MKRFEKAAVEFRAPSLQNSLRQYLITDLGKLECLSLPVNSVLVLYFRAKLGAYPKNGITQGMVHRQALTGRKYYTRVKVPIAKNTLAYCDTVVKSLKA